MLSAAQKLGKRWEAKIAKLFGGRLVVGSGSKWFAKLDVRAGGFLISAKATESESFRVTPDMLREMRSLRNIPGGIGPDVITVLMVQTLLNEVVVIELDDFMEIVDRLSSKAQIAEVNAAQSKRLASGPQLFRVEL